MSGEDGEVDDGPPVLTAFEYPPEDNGNEMPLDNEEPFNEREVNEDNNDNNNVNNNNDGTPSEDEGEASQQDAEAEEGEDHESKTSESKSRRGSKRRHHRRSSRHRKPKESSKSSSSSQNTAQKVAADLPVPQVTIAGAAIDSFRHGNLVGAQGVGEWATLLNMYQQQFPSATGDEGRTAHVSNKIADSSSNNRSKKDAIATNTGAAKSQYEVDDVDPYKTPEGSDDEQASSQQMVGVVDDRKEPLVDNNIGTNAPYMHADYHQSYPSSDSAYPPRKRIRDDSFGGVGGDRSSPFRGGGPPSRDRGYYNDRNRSGYNRAYNDDYYDDRRGSRSPGDWQRNRRDRGMGTRRGRDRHDIGPPRRGRNQEYNDYDQPPANDMAGYESHHGGYDGHYGQEVPPYRPELPPYQPPPPDFERGYPPPPDSYDDLRHSRFRDEDSGFESSRGGRRSDRGMGRRGGKNDRPGSLPPAQPEILQQPPLPPSPPPQQQRPNPPPQQQQQQQQQQDPPRPGMICKFFREGNCLKGSNCNFAHLLPSEIKRKPELCKFYLSGFCIKGNDCDYMHEQFPCKFFHTSGNCRNGNNCRFSHGPLDEEGRKMLDKAVSAWGANMQQAPGDQTGGYVIPPEDQQQQQQQPGFIDVPNQQQPYNGNGPPGFYGVDVLGGNGDQQQQGANAPFQSPPQSRGPPFMPPPGVVYEPPPPQMPDSTIRPPYADFMPPPPPNFPPMPPFIGQNQPPYFPSPGDLSSPPQFIRPPAPTGFPPSSPNYQAPLHMPPLPPTLSAEQIHQLASGMPPGMPPLPPFAQSPPTSTGLPTLPVELGSLSPGSSSRDPRLNVNRASSEASISSSGGNKMVRYKLISVLIPPPVPLSLALRLDPMDPIIRLDPRLRKVFGVATTTNP